MGDARLQVAARNEPAQIDAHLSNPERLRIVEALERCAGNQSCASKLLGIARGTLIVRLIEYGIPRPRTRRPS